MEKFGYLCKAKTLAVLGAACLATATSAFAATAVVQKLNYTDQLQSFYNPDRGFYSHQVINFKPESTTPPKPYSNKIIHLRATIAAFSDNATWKENNEEKHGKTQDLTNAMLDDFRSYLEQVRAQNSTVIVRFCYDYNYNGKGNQEPSQEWILKHTRQLSAVFNEYKDVIIFVEQGMYGPYGEQHTSTISNPLYVGEGLATLLQNTDHDVDVGPRNPSVIARGLGFSPETVLNAAGDTTAWNYNVSFNIDHPYFKFKADSLKEDIYRVGFFNDGYLGTQYDYGTWGSVCATSICRQEAVAFMETYGKNVPYGGEALTTADGWKKINTVEFLSYEGFRTHTSYLNISWNYNLINEWKKSAFHPRDTIDKAYESYTDGEGTLQNTAFKYIDDHLGYRYVLRESKMMDSLGTESVLKLDMKIQNVGFGNMTKERPITIVLRPITESAKDTIYGDPQEFKPCDAFDPQNILSRKVVLKSALDDNGNIADFDNVKSETTFDGINQVMAAVKLPKTLSEGKYAVYLRISQYGNWPADSNYSAVRFANDSNYYDKKTGANYIGSFVLSKSAPMVKPSKDACPSLLPKSSSSAAQPKSSSSEKTSIIPQAGLVSASTIHVEIHANSLTVQNARRVEIFDLMGHKLMARDLPTQAATIPLNKTPRGALLVRAYGAGTVKTQVVNLTP